MTGENKKAGLLKEARPVVKREWWFVSGVNHSSGRAGEAERDSLVIVNDRHASMGARHRRSKNGGGEAGDAAGGEHERRSSE
jgi:hypothetical protein